MQKSFQNITLSISDGLTLLLKIQANPSINTKGLLYNTSVPTPLILIGASSPPVSTLKFAKPKNSPEANPD